MPRALLMVGLLAAVLPAQDGATVRLQHRFLDREPFAFTIRVDSQSSFEDDRKNSRMRFLLRFSAIPGAEVDGHTEVACTLQRLTATVEAPNAHIQFDSSDEGPAIGPLQKLEQLLHAKFLVPVAPDGTLGEVTVPEPLAAIAKDHLGTDFRSLFAAYFVPLPTMPVAIGDTFDRESMVFGVQTGGTQTLVHHKLLGVTEGRAELECTFDAEKPTPRPGVRFEVREARGRIAFDLARGRVLRAEAELLARATRTGGCGTVSATSSLLVSAQLEGAENGTKEIEEPTKRDGKPGNEAGR